MGASPVAEAPTRGEIAEHQARARVLDEGRETEAEPRAHEPLGAASDARKRVARLLQ